MSIAIVFMFIYATTALYYFCVHKQPVTRMFKFMNIVLLCTVNIFVAELVVRNV